MTFFFSFRPGKKPKNQSPIITDKCHTDSAFFLPAFPSPNFFILRLAYTIYLYIQYTHISIYFLFKFEFDSLATQLLLDYYIHGNHKAINLIFIILCTRVYGCMDKGVRTESISVAPENIMIWRNGQNPPRRPGIIHNDYVYCELKTFERRFLSLECLLVFVFFFVCY